MKDRPSTPVHDDRAAKAAKAIAVSLHLADRMLSLYAEDHAYCKKSVARLQDDLDQFLRTFGDCTLHVEKKGLTFKEELIYEGTDKEGDFALALFRDGVFTLSFLKGIEIEETSALLRILHRYRNLSALPEDDIVTALWEAQLPHIQYGVADTILEVDKDGKLTPWEVNDLLAQFSRSHTSEVASPIQVSTPTAFAQSTPQVAGLDITAEQLTVAEAEELEEMVRSEEERDATQEILDMMADILQNQADESFFGYIADYMEEELRASFERKDFEISLRILQTLRHAQKVSEGARPEALPRIKKFFATASQPKFLEVLVKNWHTLRVSQIDKAREALRLLAPEAIEPLGLMLLEAPASVQAMLCDVIVSLASLNPAPLVKIIYQADEELLSLLVPLLGRLECTSSAQVLIRLIRHSSDRIRWQVLRAIIVRGLWAPEKLAPLLEDTSLSIKQLLIKYLGSRRSEAAEGVLLEYLRSHKFGNDEDGFLLACFRALGECGTDRALPFLSQALTGGNFLSRLRASSKRQGAALALAALGTEKARAILDRALQSIFPAIRNAAGAVSEELGGLSEQR
jgi:HEAT repeat protein